MVLDSLSSLSVVATTLVAGAFSYVFFKAIKCPAAELDESLVRKLAIQAGDSKSSENLLLGNIAIVTGSTSGIGEAIALQLYQLNCTVIIASRSPTKCAATADKIRSLAPKSKGSLVILPLDICDLDNVATFVTDFKQNYSKLNYLVNNAGMMYVTDMMHASTESPLKSPQGYDLAFATNFMGHFLLTELLLPLLKETPKSRILNVSSSVHFQVSGDALRPPGGEQMPVAARSDIFTTRHWIDSYGNSKFAQLLHMNALQKMLAQDQSTDLKVVSVCPGFVKSAMVPKGPIAQFISRFFFSCRAAVLTPMHALFDQSLRGGEWLTNFSMIWTSNSFAFFLMSVFVKLGFRDIFVASIATPQVVLFQNCSYGVHNSIMSNEAKNDELIKLFYAWCLKETRNYLNKSD